MKSCPYCGATFADDIQLCPSDQTPLVAAKHQPGRPERARPPALGPAGPWLIFSGVAIAILAILFVFTSRAGSIRGVSGKALPWVIVLVTVGVIVACREVYHHLPRRAAIKLGIIGWILASFLLCWFFWFGPGALKR